MLRTSTTFLILIVIALLGYAGGFWGGAWYFEQGNTYLHFAGGLFIGLLVASYYRSEFAKLSQPFRFFSLIGIVMGIGVFWEFHEFILTAVAGQAFMGDLADTIKDLLMDTLGGIGAGLYVIGRGNTKNL